LMSDKLVFLLLFVLVVLLVWAVTAALLIGAWGAVAAGAAFALLGGVGDHVHKRAQRPIIRYTVPALSVFFFIVIFGFYFGTLVGTPFYLAAFFSAFAIAASGMFIIILCIKIFWEGQPSEG